MSMLARNTRCDVAVIGLIGERGREVQEFIEDDLGPEGLARSVVVVATSDEPALMRSLSFNAHVPFYTGYSTKIMFFKGKK